MDNAAGPLAPPSSPVSGPVGPAGFPPPPKPSGMSGCLKVLLIVAGFLALLMLLIGILVWQTVSWVQNIAQPTPITFPALTPSAGEQEDIQRVLQGLNDAKQKGQEFDEYMTPAVFNGVLDRILQGERAKGKPEVPLGVRGSFVGDAIKLELSTQADQKALEAAGKQGSATPYYVNAEAVFKLEIVDNEAKAIELKQLKVGGRDAPGILMWVIRKQTEAFMLESKNLKNRPDNPFGAIKLLRREGERLHLILDGKKMPD